MCKIAYDNVVTYIEGRGPCPGTGGTQTAGGVTLCFSEKGPGSFGQGGSLSAGGGGGGT